jgi:hypothetical protein
LSRQAGGFTAAAFIPCRAKIISVSALSADHQKDHDSGNNNDYQHFLWADQHSRHNDSASLFIQPISGKSFFKRFLWLRLLQLFSPKSKEILGANSVESLSRAALPASQSLFSQVGWMKT